MDGIATSTCARGWPASLVTLPVRVTGSCASMREATDSQSPAAADTLRTFKGMIVLLE